MWFRCSFGIYRCDQQSLLLPCWHRLRHHLHWRCVLQYYTLARSLHPDKNLDDPAAKDSFQRLGEAYQVRSRPDSRQVTEAKHEAI